MLDKYETEKQNEYVQQKKKRKPFDWRAYFILDG